MGGYITKRINGKKLLVHRLIIEEYFGRKLSRDEIVHHINGNKKDNRLENLVVMTNSAHMQLHYFFDKNRFGFSNKEDMAEHARNLGISMRKLSIEEVLEIRKIYIKGDSRFGCDGLSKKYNVGATTIRQIVNNKRYTESKYYK